MRNLFFDLLEINIAVSVIILILLLFSEKLRERYGAVWMKSVWLLLVVRLLVPYNFSLPFTEIRLLNVPGFEQETRNLESIIRISNVPDEILNFTENSIKDNMPQADTKTNAPENHFETTDFEATDFEITNNQAGTKYNLENETNQSQIKENQTGETSAVPQRGNFDINNFSYSELLTYIWMSGVCLCLLYLFFSSFYFNYKCRRSLSPVTDKKLKKELLSIQKELTGKTDIPVYQSRIVSSPVLTGIIRPKLIFPIFQKTWSKKELELMMAHELCHYKNKDLFLKLLMSAACCINWFNPILLLMKKQFFYDMELACDASVLMERSGKDRETYARMMLFFAGNKNKTPIFSTSFREDKKRMKKRIDHMLDEKKKKKGIFSIVIVSVFILSASMLISCGYKPQELNNADSSTDQDNSISDISSPDSSEQIEDQEILDVSEQAASNQAFDYNNEYNDLIRCYENDLYLSREDGIYRIEGGEGEEELLYENSYRSKRGMELYRDFLYFCGSVLKDGEETATIYRMNLNTFEVEDILANFSQKFDFLFHISVYEDKLYVATGYPALRIGFELDQNGHIVSRLDETADDFLYKEYNEYMELEVQKMSENFDSEEYWRLVEESNKKYAAIIDVASCKKMLHGNQVVSRYKDELMHSLFLETENGNYEYLCDYVSHPSLITETGIYYAANEVGDIWYVDYETKTSKPFYEKTPELWESISLINYDADYIYLLKSILIDADAENNPIGETYLIRVLREDGSEEKVYQFAEWLNVFGMNGIYNHCGVYGDRLYLDTYETIILDPAANGM